MKIAHLTTHLNMGGIPVYIYTLGLNLSKNGIQQIVISSNGALVPNFNEAGIPVFVFDLKTKFAFHWKLFRQLPEIIRRLKMEKVDLIHAHTRVGQVMAQWIEIFSGIPFVSTCHGFYKVKRSRKWFPAWGRRVIAISPLVRDDLIQSHKISEKLIRMILNGIETSSFMDASKPEQKQAARKLLGIEEGEFAICFIARMILDKGPEDLLLATHLVAKKNIKLKVFMLGTGRDLEFLAEKSRELGIESNVRFMGNVFNVSAILAACDAFVHPVRVPEGFGLSIAEAMSSGLPIIANEQWALKELMLGEKMGKLITSGHPEQIAEVLENWSQSSETIREMGRNAQLIASEHFDIKKMTLKVIQIYDEALAESKG